MIINHNLSAINTLNALGKNTQATSKSLQKLSTVTALMALPMTLQVLLFRKK